MTGSGSAAVGILTGWGEGVGALPADARRAAGGRSVVPVAVPAAGGERTRRATRECRLALAAVEAALRVAGLPPAALAGPETGLVYVTAAAYGAANRAFIEGRGPDGTPAAALHFPYTAPSAVPAEVTIAYGLTGPYVILVGGAPATGQALGQAGRLLARAACRRVLVLAVETFAELADLVPRRPAVPLVEAAACAVLTGNAAPPAGDAGWAIRLAGVRRRAGETLSCAPLIALALAGADDPGPGSAAGGAVGEGPAAVRG